MRRSATRRRSFTRAVPSACASCARSSTWWRATGTFASDRQGTAASLRSVGIVGGTFNPPHLGHLAIALAGASQLGLDRVLLMPANASPHKSDAADPGAEHRLRMCELLVNGSDGVACCSLELERGGPSYTVDTLTAIHASHPATELTLIVGADTARTMPTWREPAGVLALAGLAVAARAGTDRRELLDGLSGLVDASVVTFLDTPLLDVSSSSVRRRAAVGQPIDQLVGPAVAGYVAEHQLYGARREAVG